MNDLSRSLLAAAREGMTPDADAMARVRAKVAAAVAPPPAAASAVALKLGALAALGAIVAIVVVTRPHAAGEVPRFTVAPAELEAAPSHVQLASRELAPPRSATAPLAAARSIAHDVLLPPAPPEPATREPATLSREVELIDRAMLSLRQHEARAALDAIAMFDRETLGRGQMAEEAAAIRIEAHCNLHDDVTPQLAEFDRKWPSSAQRERLQTACFAKR